MSSTYKNKQNLARLALLAIALSGAAVAAPVALDTANPQNGISDLFSATFDGALSPCGPGDPPECTFFNGKPPPGRDILILPSPTGVATAVPGGIGPAFTPTTTPPPVAGSFLDLALGGGNTQLTLAGGTVSVGPFANPIINLVIRQGEPDETNIVAGGGANGAAGMVINAGAVTVPVDANGVAIFEVTLAPNVAADFSTLSTVVTSCNGSLCALIPILTLDMVRYRMVIDYDPSFSYFTGTFTGQTANNSLLSFNLNSGVPDITVDPSSVPFGNVQVLTTATQTITLTNDGTANLVLGAVASANALDPPFALDNDNCSGQTLSPAADCTFDVTFTPGSVFNGFTDSLDIPSNDPNEASVSLAVSGNGVAAPEPNIVVTDSVAPANDQNVPFGSVIIGGQGNQTVTVTNTGNAGLDISDVASANPLLAPFSVTSDTCSNTTVASGGGTCSIGLRFEPTVAGPVSDSFDIPSNDLDTPTITVAVSGTTPVGADITAPASVQFGNVVPGFFTDRTVTVTNDGTGNLVIGNVAQANPLPSQYSIESDGCSGQTVAAAASCTISLRFTPDAIANFDDSFDIPSNDPDESTVTVIVRGSGVEAVVIPPVNASGADGGFMAMDPATLAALAVLLVWVCRGRRSARL
jgi:hypothetical protein